MTPNELRALAEALEPMARAPRFEDFDVPGFCAWVRACADAQPVPVVPVDWTGRLKEAVKNIGYANVEKWYRLGGEDMIELAKADAVTAYATLCEALESLAAAPVAPQAEPADRCRSSETPSSKATSAPSKE